MSHLPVHVNRENWFYNFLICQKLVEKRVICSPGFAAVTQAYYPVCVHHRIVERVWKYPDFRENQVSHVQMVQLFRRTKQKNSKINSFITIINFRRFWASRMTQCVMWIPTYTYLYNVCFYEMVMVIIIISRSAKNI